MKSNVAALVLWSALAGTAAAQGIDPKDYARLIELKDGGKVYVFKDGRMAYEDKFGRPARIAKGTVLETKKGEKLTVKSDDEGRLIELEPKN